jgi:hypothetical protein
MWHKIRSEKGYTDARNKTFQNALPVSFLLRKNSWDSILERSVTQIPLHILAVNITTLIWSGNSWKDEVKRLAKTSLSQYSIQFSSIHLFLCLTTAIKANYSQYCFSGYQIIKKGNTYHTDTAQDSTGQVVAVTLCSSFLPVPVGYHILAQHIQCLLAYSNSVHKVLKCQCGHHLHTARHYVDNPMDRVWLWLEGDRV